MLLRLPSSHCSPGPVTPSPHHGVGAGIGAAVAVDAVAIITLFARLDDLVAAGRQRAGIGAAIVIDAVAVITGPHRHCAHPSPTFRSDAGVGAVVVVDAVAVITFFTRAGVAIATSGQLAARCTSVVVEAIAIVTFFASPG